MSVTFDPPPIPLARPASTVRVVRYDRKKTSGFFKSLPNVVPLGVQIRDADSLPVARFRYQLIDDGDPRFPSHVEEVIGLDKTGRYIVAQDDRLCVIRDDADGGYTILFDGFAQVPQVDASDKGESATFEAIGVAIREWDTPIGGATFRNVIANVDLLASGETTTERPTRFNPDGIGNAVPNSSAYWAGTSSDRKYPVFLDPYPLQGDGTEATAFVTAQWDVAGAAKYLMGVGNPSSKYVQCPDFIGLDDILASKSPTAGDAFDPADPAETTTDPILCQDFDATGEPWPTALAKLVKPHGFDFAFILDQTALGTPYTRLEFFRIDDADEVAPKECNLQAVGASFDPGATNVSAFAIQRDASKIANQIVLDTELVRYEASFVLAPAFAIAAGDVSTLDNYKSDGVNFSGSNFDAYRTFIFDELGEGHWSFVTSATVTTTPSLDTVLGAPPTDPVTGKPDPEYANRRRKPIGKLFSTQNGKPLAAQLWLSTDYIGNRPGVWDGTGTWQLVGADTWNLLRDRLGIRFIGKDPSNIQIGKPTTATPPFPSGKVNIVQSLAASNTANPRFYLRLTCVIEGDQTPGITAKRRATSLSQYAIIRRINVRDWFVKHVITKSSHLNTTGKTIDARDDSVKATDYANAMRTAHENARFAGSITIPRLTTAYQVGDKISLIRGRNIDLRSNTGKAQGEAAEYPVVVGVSWDFDGKQTTSLVLSDRRADPAGEHSR